MALPTDILMMYGYLLLFAWVLVEQLGLPLPATPVLLAAGALSAESQISFPLALAVAWPPRSPPTASGSSSGAGTATACCALLCKLSLEPTTCVRRTQDSFGRRRGAMLLFAKFVPGLGTLAAPVAGQNGMSFAAFLLYDGIGAALWVCALLACGRFFGDLLKRNASLLNWAGRFSGALLDSGRRGILSWRASFAAAWC